MGTQRFLQYRELHLIIHSTFQWEQRRTRHTFLLLLLTLQVWLRNNKYHRYNVTFRNTAKFLNDKLTLDVSASYIREFYNNMVSFGTYFNPIVGAYLYPRGMNFESEKYFERYNNELGYNAQNWQPGGMGMDVQNPYWIAYRNLRPEAKTVICYMEV